MAERVHSQRDGRAKGREATEGRDAANPAQNRQKGLWNFLTWSFFISQILLAQQAYAGAANLGATGDDHSSTGDGDPAHAATATLLPLGKVAAIEPPGLTAVAASVPTPDALSPTAAPPPIVAHAEPIQLAHATTQQSIVQAGNFSDSPASALSAPGAAPGIQLGTIPPPVVGQVIAPVIEIIEGGVVGPVVNTVVTPVIQTLEPVVNAVTPVVDAIVTPVVQAVNPIVDAVVAPITQVADSVIQTVAPVVDAIVAPATQLSDSVIQTVAPVVDTVAAPIVDAIQAVTPALDAVIAPVTEVTGNVIEAAAPVVDALIAPATQISEAVVQAASPVLDAAASLVEAAQPVLDAVTPVVQSVAEPVVDALTPAVQTVESVLETATPVVQTIVEPVVDAATSAADAVGPVVDAIIPAVDSITGPAMDAVTPTAEAITQPVLDAATPAVSDALSALTSGGDGSGLGTLLGVQVSGEQPIVVASGSLDFPDAGMTAAADSNELFSAGSYTDYSISLTSQTPGGASETSVTGPAVSSSLLDQVLGSTADVHDEAPVQVPTVTPPSISHSIGWHGDGFHL